MDNGSGDEPTWDLLLDTNALFESSDSIGCCVGLKIMFSVGLHLCEYGIELWHQMSGAIYSLAVKMG